MKVAAVQLRSDPSRTPSQNTEHALEMASEAASANVDLIVLPEAVSMLCYPDGRPDFSYRDVAEAPNGRTVQYLSRLASECEVNIVAGVIEDRGDDAPCQNVALVFDRTGRIVGRYEKIHEPEVCRLQQDAGTGSDVPVFNLDIGVIGVAICWDINYPELFSLLAYKGARIICFPHLIGLPSTSNFSVQLRARAIDTATFVVAAGMRDNGSHSSVQEGTAATCIVSPAGEVIAQAATEMAEVVIEDIDPASEGPSRLHRRRIETDLRFDVLAREYVSLASRRQR